MKKKKKQVTEREYKLNVNKKKLINLIKKKL